MPQMPEAISRIIDATEAYTNEITAIENEIVERQNWLAKFRKNTNKENWPNIYMIGRCVKLFSTCHYSMLGEDYVEHDIEPGEHIRFHYDYDTGNFHEDLNFLTQTSLFTYEKHRENFDIVAYVTLPNVVKSNPYCGKESNWPSGLSWTDSLPEGGRLYIVNFDDMRW